MQTISTLERIASNMQDQNILVVTGHRPQRLMGFAPETEQSYLRSALNILKKHPADIIVHGGAMGTDSAFADAAEILGLATIYAEPCLNSIVKWSPSNQEKAKRRMNYAARTGAHVLVSEQPYTKKSMDARNQWMVDLLRYAKTGNVLSVWDRASFGGTYQCLKYFMAQYPHDHLHRYLGNFFRFFKMGWVEVANIRQRRPNPLVTEIYCGRGATPHNMENALLGNPCFVGDEYSQGEAADAYLGHLRELCSTNTRERETILSLAHRVCNGEHLRLYCWCAPKKCHCDHIRAAIEGYAFRLLDHA